ncbi:MAG TPA: Fic family protein [Candidatus Saccharimonadales bacterium]|nr:Fic family protein [Candidatus Saccharimonadales bacterium]
MAYQLDKDPYINPETGVLRNLFGAKDLETLSQIEAEITVAVIATLDEHPIPGDFDLEHLKAIHKRLFASIYDWAGKLRTVEMAKDNTRFAPIEYLQEAAATLFNALKSEKYLDDMQDAKYIKRFAHYYSEVNILHPFREGNGRAERTFFSLLAQRSGRHIAWDLFDPDEAIRASIEAYNGDESQLVKLLTPLITKYK